MLSLLFFLISSLGCILVANTLHCDPEKITDLIISSFPKIELPYASDFLITCQLAYTIVFISEAEQGEIFLIMSVVQVLRMICMVCTVLPPLKSYQDKQRLGGINGSGTEYIFSGHASYSALTAIYLIKQVDPIPLCLYNLVSQMLIILTHNHYTIDVVLAWIIVPLLYGNLEFCKREETCVSYLEKLV